jgi:hypothetical protein
MQAGQGDRVNDRRRLLALLSRPRRKRVPDGADIARALADLGFSREREKVREARRSGPLGSDAALPAAPTPHPASVARTRAKAIIFALRVVSASE